MYASSALCSISLKFLSPFSGIVIFSVHRIVTQKSHTQNKRSAERMVWQRDRSRVFLSKLLARFFDSYDDKVNGIHDTIHCYGIFYAMCARCTVCFNFVLVIGSSVYCSIVLAVDVIFFGISIYRMIPVAYSRLIKPSSG